MDRGIGFLGLFFLFLGKYYIGFFNSGFSVFSFLMNLKDLL